MVMLMNKYDASHGLPQPWATVTVTLDRSDPDVAAYGCEVSLEGNLTNAQRQKILRAARVCPVRRTLGCRTVVTESVRR